MKKPSLFAALLLAAPAAATAATVAEENASDMRCMIILSELAESKDKEIETAGLIGSQYYLGRIDGRSPDIDLEALLVQEAEKLTEADKPGLLTSCGAKIESRGKAVAAIGDKVANGQ